MKTTKEERVRKIIEEKISKTKNNHCCFIGFKLDKIDKQIILRRIKMAKDNDVDKIEFNDGSLVKCSPQKCEPIIITEDGTVIHDSEENKQILAFKEYLKNVNDELDSDRETLRKISEIEKSEFEKLMAKINNGKD